MKKESTLHFALNLVHWSTQLSNFSLIEDFTKVVDFIDDTKDLV